MKKAYENPVAEKIVFDYTTSVVASGKVQYGGPTAPFKCDIIVPSNNTNGQVCRKS